MLPPETEATQAALGAGVLAALGALLGRFVRYEGGRITVRPNLYAVVVGPTAKARKGTAEGEVLRLLKDVAPDFARKGIVGGFGSGEAVIERLADAEYDENLKLLRGRTDQRLLVVEGEFAKVLRIADRKGSILGDIIRPAVDSRPLENRIRGKVLNSTNHNVSLFGGITPGELLELFSELAATNGVGNRFLWVWSESEKLLPYGGNAQAGTGITFHQPLGVAFSLTTDGQAWWGAQYERLRNLDHVPENVRPMVTRTTDHVLSIALTYAATEGAAAIARRHLDAALAWVKYSQATVQAVFGGLVQSKVAGKVLGVLREQPGVPVSRTELHRVLGNHHTGGALSQAFNDLAREGLAFTWRGPSTGGAPPELAVATTPERGRP